MTVAPEARRDVLVTLANSGWVDAAKQVFSSAYHRAGWDGDYLLLAHQIPEVELAWFEERGIQILRCSPLFDWPVGGMPSVSASKLYVFGTDFRRWRTIVYVDADSTIRAPLDSLRGLQGFGAVLDWNPLLKLQLTSPAERRARHATRGSLATAWRVLSGVDLWAPAFNAGFFALDSDLILAETRDALVDLVSRLDPMSRFGEQLALNLHFRDKWYPLSPIHNLLLHNGRAPLGVRPDDFDPLILHFSGAKKPWMGFGAHAVEWREMRDRADAIDVRSVPSVLRTVSGDLAAAGERLHRRLGLGRVIHRIWAWVRPVSPFRKR